MSVFVLTNCYIVVEGVISNGRSPLMFANAKTLKTGGTKTKAEKEQVEINGLEAVGALDAVIKSLSALKATYEETAKSAMLDHFIEVGCKAKKRPESFRGIEGIVSASCELRARSSTSGLSADEIATCTEFKIPTETVSDVPETFAINPDYAGDTKMLAAVQKALEPLVKKGAVPPDLFMKIEARSRVIAAKGALDAVFARSSDEARKLVGIVGTLAIKPKVESEDGAVAAFKLVERLMSADEQADEQVA